MPESPAIFVVTTFPGLADLRGASRVGRIPGLGLPRSPRAGRANFVLAYPRPHPASRTRAGECQASKLKSVGCKLLNQG